MERVSKLVVVGIAAAASLAAPPLCARDGDLDPRFGTGGMAQFLFQADHGVFPFTPLQDVAVTPDGGLVVAGSVYSGAGDADLGVVRLNSSGNVVTVFGISGGTRIAFNRPGSGMHDEFSGLAVQADGRILVAGTAAGAAADGSDFVVVRLTTTGQPDQSFGIGGRVIVPFNLGPANAVNDSAARLTLQPDGRILVAGMAQVGPGSNGAMAIVRLTNVGLRDSSFDVDGRVSIQFGAPYTSAQALRARQLASGAVLVVGIATRPHPSGIGMTTDFALARLTATGALDPAFGVGGKVTFDFGVGGDGADGATDFVELPDGRLIACGFARAFAPGNTDMACQRFLANGTPDPGYPPVLVPFDAGGSHYDIAMQAVLDAQGRLLLAGHATTTENMDFAVARLRPDGSLDPSFGRNGARTVNSCTGPCVDPEAENVAAAIALQSDGRIVLAGRVKVNAVARNLFMVARMIGDTLLADGFDPSP